MKQINVSVIVPVYNVEKWAGRCLKSLVNQDFENFEIIVVDDGSTDNSKKICRYFSNKYKKIKFYSKKNGGLSDARNYGLKVAKGKYVVFVDSDDFVKPNYISSLYNNLKETNSTMAICGFYLTDEKGKELSDFPISRTLNIPLDKKIISGKELIRYLYNESGWVDIPAWNKIYPKNIFDEFKFKKGVYFEDSALMHHLLWNIKKIAIVHIPLYSYVQRENSILNSPLNLKKIKDRNFYMTDRISFFKHRDAELYELSVAAYKEWIIRIIMENPVLLKQPSIFNFYKLQYKKMCKVRPRKIKLKLKDCMCFLNFKFAIKCFKLINYR